MKHTVMLALAVALIPAACNKPPPAPPQKVIVAPPPSANAPKADGQAPTPQPPATSTATAPPAPPGNLKEFESSVVLADLTKNLQIFVIQKGRFPRDLGELSRDCGMPIPKSPPGTMLVIDQKSKSVKVVPAN